MLNVLTDLANQWIMVAQCFFSLLKISEQNAAHQENLKIPSSTVQSKPYWFLMRSGLWLSW